MPLVLNVIREKKVPCSEEKKFCHLGQTVRPKRTFNTGEVMTVENKQKNTKISSCNSTSLHFSVWVVLLESAEAAKSCFSPWYQAGYHLKSIINLTLRGPSINDVHIFREGDCVFKWMKHWWCIAAKIFWDKSAKLIQSYQYRGFLPYATFGTWKKTALAKNRISNFFILCTQ